MERLKSNARNEADENTSGIGDFLKTWWSRKYKLPTNHPLLLKRSPGDLYQEMLKDFHKERNEVVEAIKETSKPSPELLTRLQALEQFLGIRPDDVPVLTGDVQVDNWEAAMAKGETPQDMLDWLNQPVKKVKSRTG